MIAFGLQTKFDDAGLGACCSSAFSSAVGVLGDAILHDSDPYVPYDTGHLSRSGTRSSVTDTAAGFGCSVVWKTPYARAVYYGDGRRIRFRTEHHPHARARWFEGARNAALPGWLEAARETVKQGFVGGGDGR